MSNVYELRPNSEKLSSKPIEMRKTDQLTMRLYFANEEHAMIYLNDIDRTRYQVKSIFPTAAYPDYPNCTVLDLKLRG